MGCSISSEAHMPAIAGIYHGFKVYVGERTRIRGASVGKDEVVLILIDKIRADRDGGWVETDLNVFEKIVPKHEVSIVAPGGDIDSRA